ncbi:TIGR04282 family arsenosugar biosynthesis glycosyltransferase [Streptomyces sp. NPDC054784]
MTGGVRRGGGGSRDSAAARTGPEGPTTLLVLAKEPVPGRVKTRLTPPYTPEQGAALAAAALADTLALAAAVPARRRVLVLDGAPGPWLPEDAGFEVVPQAAGGLDARIAAAFAGCDGPALLLGMDTPQLTPGLLRPVTAPDAWDGCDAWFGPAADGGFWALGLAEPDPALIRGVPMSVARTGAVQRRRLVDAGLSVRDLPVLRDVDTARDAAEVAGQCAAPRADGATYGAVDDGHPYGGGTRFAAAYAELRPAVAR